MKRNELVDRLVKEGLSEKTLSKLTDNQLNILGERMLQEQMSGPVKGSVQMKKTASNPSDIKRMTDSGVNVTLTEKLKGNQSKIDKNHNGKIDGQDFKILQGQKKKEVKEVDMGLTIKSNKKSTAAPKKKDVDELLRFYDDDGNPIKDKKGNQDAVSTKDKKFGEKTKSKKCPDCGEYEKDCKCGHQHMDEKKSNVKEGTFSDMGHVEHGGHEIPVYQSGDKKMFGHPRKKGDHSSGGNKFGYNHDRLPQIKKAIDKFNSENPNGDKSFPTDRLQFDESKPSAGLSKEKKSEVVKKAQSGGDIGKKGKGFEKIADKAAEKYGSKEKGEKVAAASMWKNIKRESVEKKSWVKNLVENEFFHNFTSKGEIMELIQSKLNENQTMVQHGPKVKKGHNGIPEFMSYDVLTAAEPKTAPSKPKTSPGTKPSPDKAPSPKHPYAPGPAEKPEPKAQMRENKKAK